MTRFLTCLLAVLVFAFPTPGEETSAAKPEKLKNTLRWSTASEVDNFGFDIYRADKEEGPFERITAQPIPGAGTVDEPSYYEYGDDTIEPDKPYWYYVESISNSGEREKFTPIFKAGPKSAPKQGEEGEKGEGSASGG